MYDCRLRDAFVYTSIYASTGSMVDSICPSHSTWFKNNLFFCIIYGWPQIATFVAWDGQILLPILLMHSIAHVQLRLAPIPLPGPWAHLWSHQLIGTEQSCTWHNKYMSYLFLINLKQVTLELLLDFTHYARDRLSLAWSSHTHNYWSISLEIRWTMIKILWHVRQAGSPHWMAPIQISHGSNWFIERVKYPHRLTHRYNCLHHVSLSVNVVKTEICVVCLWSWSL